MRVVDMIKPDILPVLLEEFKDHLRIDGDEEASALASFLAVAVQLIEQRYDMALIARTAQVYLDKWETASKVNDRWWQGVASGSVESLFFAGRFALLPVRPLADITAVETQNSSGEWLLWPEANYSTVKGLEGGINRRAGNGWPLPGVAKSGIRLTVSYGFSEDWNGVPASIRQSILMLAAFLYSNRGTAQTEDIFMASGVKPMLAPYERKRL